MTRAVSKDTQPMLGAFLRFPRAMAAIAKLSDFGTKKYKVPMGDMSYTDAGADFYREKIGKHLLEEQITGSANLEDDGQHHAVAIAWNALARVECLLLEAEKTSRDVQPAPAEECFACNVATLTQAEKRGNVIDRRTGLGTGWNNRNPRPGPKERTRSYEHLHGRRQGDPGRHGFRWLADSGGTGTWVRTGG